MTSCSDITSDCYSNCLDQYTYARWLEGNGYKSYDIVTPLVRVNGQTQVLGHGQRFCLEWLPDGLLTWELLCAKLKSVPLPVPNTGIRVYGYDPATNSCGVYFIQAQSCSPVQPRGLLTAWGI